jgi:hypothetical protein
LTTLLHVYMFLYVFIIHHMYTALTNFSGVLVDSKLSFIF